MRCSVSDLYYYCFQFKQICTGLFSWTENYLPCFIALKKPCLFQLCFCHRSWREAASVRAQQPTAASPGERTAKRQHCQSRSPARRRDALANRRWRNPAESLAAEITNEPTTRSNTLHQSSCRPS